MGERIKAIGEKNFSADKTLATSLSCKQYLTRQEKISRNWKFSPDVPILLNYLRRVNWEKIEWPRPENFQSFVLTDFAASFHRFCLLESGGSFKDPFASGSHRYQNLAAFGMIDEVIASKDSLAILDNFLAEPNWYFGHLNYELKDQIEPQLASNNKNHSKFPLFSFFVPEIVIAIKQSGISVWIHSKSKWINRTDEINIIINQTKNNPEKIIAFENQIAFIKPSKDSYNSTFKKIHQHILRGDIYELNYCIPFIAENCSIDPYYTWGEIVKSSPAPFSCFYRQKDQWLISASPERFLRKEGSRIFSQPIKGTIRRDPDPETDLKLKSQLATSEKERAENVMIVDLVRNDLSKIATKSSVRVEELFGIYAFPKVHQMISTISAEAKPNLTFSQILHALFPMGSMTGAPKVRAMEIIEEMETFQRGLFSGSVGYISPEGDFDFNVIIRSIFYDEKTHKVLVAAGSAITEKSDAHTEYEECLLKAEALLQILNENHG